MHALMKFLVLACLLSAAASVSQAFLNRHLVYADSQSNAATHQSMVPTAQCPEAKESTLPLPSSTQSIPPYYLMQRFEGAPNAPGTQRLFYLTSRLNPDGTHIEDWKRIATSQWPISRR